MPQLICAVDDSVKTLTGEARCIIRSFAGLSEGQTRRDAVHRWLRQTLAAELHVSEASVELVRAERGKPLLRDHPGLHFNLSHSGTLAALALSGERPVGVDIERISGCPEVRQRIATRFFHTDELTWLAQQSGDVLLHFTTLWSLKEAWLKLSGAGLSHPLSAFSVVPSREGRATVCECDGLQVGQVDYQIIQDTERYCLAYTMDCTGDNPPVRWRIIFQQEDI